MSDEDDGDEPINTMKPLPEEMQTVELLTIGGGGE